MTREVPSNIVEYILTGLFYRGLALCLLLVAIMLLVACGGGTGAEIQLQSQVRLTCTQECSDRGQCGTALDGRRFVLGREFEPAVSAHDRLFPENTLVVANSNEIRTLQPVRPEPTGGEPFPHAFYHVTIIDGSKSAWVSSWCILPG